MFETIRKLLDSPAAMVALVALFVAGIVFLVRLQSDVRHLQTDVTQLQQQVESNHTEVLKAIDAAVDELLTTLANHTHDADGKVRVTLPQ